MKAIIQKLGIIQSELKAPKNNTNSFGEYKYRSAEDILEALKPLLKQTETTLTISDEVLVCGNQPVKMSETETVIVDRVYIKATATLSDGVDSISTVGLAREVDDKKKMDYAQITGATSSYARKYALNGLFCIDDTKDADATNTGNREQDGLPLPITQVQQDQIIMLGQGKNIDTLRNHIKETYGVESSSQLNRDQATDLINYLRGIK